MSTRQRAAAACSGAVARLTVAGRQTRQGPTSALAIVDDRKGAIAGGGEVAAVELAAAAGLGLLATGEVEGEGVAGVEGDGDAAWGVAGVAGPDGAPGLKKLGDRPAGRAARFVAAEVMPW